MNENPYSFLSGVVQDADVGRVIAQVDELKDAGSTSSTLLKWTRHDRQWTAFELSWHATRLCMGSVPEPYLLAVGPAGFVLGGNAQGTFEEEIDASDEGPGRRGDIRDLRFIGDHAYVAGMSRQVYRREGPGRWVRQDSGTVQPLGALELAGFNAIDGLSESDVFAVGFGGEIWRRHEQVWRQLDSPTNLVLHRVRVISSNLAYACGQEGVLLRGNGDQWEAIPQDTVIDDLWGMEWYREQLYVACDSGLFVLTDEDDLSRVDMGLGDVSTRHLHQNDGVLWSFGPKHVIWTEDGINWEDVTP